ncbi:hypothetical protein PCA20602_02693 [Pandoraea capi]|uniref:Lipoprotein n=1 Tax=Pandoraea capi TaxID=2508286 RepID=A0ABY6W0W0_9BURK|nr:hypothetical protein [Pandoraea capi]VVE12229.1 hypothetical protein PCA20602_02693 [Pandoraea capi]
MRTLKVSFWGGVAVGVLGAAFWRFPPQSSGDWASWVQAVGSIAAIAGAFLIGERQSSAARKTLAEERVAEEKARLARYFAIAEVACEAAQNTGTVISSGLQTGSLAAENGMPGLTLFLYEPETLNDAVDSLRLIPIDQLGSVEAIKAFDRFRRVVLSVHAAQRRLQELGAFDRAYAVGIRVEEVRTSELDALKRQAQGGAATVKQFLAQLKTALHLPLAQRGETNEDC